MDPVSLQSPSVLYVRPSAAAVGDVARILQPGRVLEGEVLQTFGGDSILIAIGRHRVSAQSQVELAPGDRFLFEVQAGEGGVVLKLLSGSGGDLEPTLLRALRAVLGLERPLGETLARLADALAEPAPATPSVRSELARALAAHVFQPGADGAELRDFLGRSGASYEPALASVALAATPPGELAAAARALVRIALDALARGAPLADSAALDLGAWLRAELGRAAGGPDSIGSLPRAALAELARDLEGTLARALRRLPEGAHRAALESNLRALDLRALGPQLRLLLFAGLAGVDPAPAFAMQPEEVVRRLALSGRDLKAELMRAHASLPEGAARDAVARALAGVEAEQLLDLARTAGGEPRHWSLPLQDGQRWTTLHVLQRRGDETGRERSGDEGAQRLTVAFDFSRTGPVRADLLVRPQRISARVLVGRPDVLARFRSDLSDLEARLSGAGRTVQVTVGLASAEELSIESELSDIRFLRERHLMDLSG